MLDTQLRSVTRAGTPASPRTGAPSRPVPRHTVSTRPAFEGNAARAALPQRSPDVHEPLRRSRRKANGDTRLLTMAIGVTGLVCALLVVYLAAYAHVTLLGIDQAHARVDLRQARLQNETLRATLATLESPKKVEKNAVALGMTRDVRHVDYILPGTKAALRP